jgi:hypothetical protein
MISLFGELDANQRPPSPAGCHSLRINVYHGGPDKWVKISAAIGSSQGSAAVMLRNG